MSKINWGVLGCSDFAGRRGIPAMRQSMYTHLMAVASRTKDKAKSFQEQFDVPRSYGSYEELLQDPDIQAVHIVLPNSMHAEWSIKALQHGKHVLCEKPSAITASQAKQVQACVEQTGLQFMEGFMWRLHPQHKLAKEIIDRGDIGAVRIVRAALSFSIAHRHVSRLDPELGAGSLLDVGGYTISGARFYFQQEPTSVHAVGTLDPCGRFDRKMAAILQFSSGTALIDFGFDLPYRGDLEIVGESGRIYMPKAWQPPPQAIVLVNDEPITLPESNHYVLEFDHFSQCILEGQRTKFGAGDALAQVRAVDAIRESFNSSLLCTT